MMKDKAINPSYYDSIFDRLLDHKFTTEQMIIIDEFNAYKYLYRWKEKNGVQDLKKAVWYINDIVKKLEHQKKVLKEQECDLNKQYGEKYKEYEKYIYKPEGVEQLEINFEDK